jgi:hypothetical protein
MIRPWMGISLMALPLLSGPARANSITTYGVIITALGNEMQVQPIDKADAAAMMSGGSCPTWGGAAAPDAGGKDDRVLITPNGAGGLVVTPWSSAAQSSPSSTGSNPVGAGSGGSVGGGESAVSQVPVPSVGPIDTGSNSSVPPIVAPPSTPAGGTATDTSGGPLGPPSDGTTTPVAAKTPEPASLTLLAIAGLGGIGFAKRRRG